MKNENSNEEYRIPITGDLDLHTFSPRDTKSIVTEYISECHRLGIKEVRIAHGKGKSVQKNIVRKLLETHPLVISFQDAPAQFGGWGATIAAIKDKND